MRRALLGAFLLALCFVGSAQAQQVASGPCRPGHFLSAATTNATLIATGSRALCGAVVVTNTTATTALDLRFYDSASSAVCNSGTGAAAVWNIAVPTNSTAANVAGFVVSLPQDINFSGGIVACLTGAITDTDTTAAVTGVQVSYGVR